MKRLVAIAAVLVAAIVVLVLGTGASDDHGAYKVRAIFDNAGFLVPGEDVKASGVVIGAVDSLDVTPDKKAAVVLRIDDPAFRDFKRDARCQVRVQSLLGEKYVACQTTQPKADDAAPQPLLRPIEDGPGKGQYLLPVANTSSPVDLDLLNNIMREPERQRLALIVNEFGTGLAGNGDQLRNVIRRAYPALTEFDRVLRILADENVVLAKLADDSDAALTPLAHESRAISNFIDKAGATATATAERGDALEANFKRFPEFLRQLQPTMARLQRFSEEATPVFSDLRQAAPSIDQMFQQLGPFSTAALPTLRTLGDAADVSRRALLAARPVIQDVRQLATATGPLASDLRAGLTSLRDQHGIDRFMQTVLGFSGALNGFDSVSHYLRTHLILDIQCMTYATVKLSQCDSNFVHDEATTATAQAAGISRTDSKTASGAGASTGSGANVVRLPGVALPGAAEAAPADGGSAGGGAAAGEDRPAARGRDAASNPSASEDPRAGLLGYLLGSEGVR
jgi:ABC-type transporter Mla subunit MlaD